MGEYKIASLRKIKINKRKMFIYNFFKYAFSWTGFFQKSANIIFLGLDNAGKTTLLYML